MLRLPHTYLLGYRVTRLVEVKEFEKFGDLFSAFVDICWEGRQKNKKGTAKNLSFKNTANSVTGKFGQRSHPTDYHIFTVDQKMSPKAREIFKQAVEELLDFDPIFDTNGENHAVFIESRSENIHPAYPIYLSAQILANSRVYMSSLYRVCGAYLDPERAIYYTDTDSMVVSSAAAEELDRWGFIGNQLGQLSCDLHDPFDGRCAKIIRGVWAAPKGTIHTPFHIAPGHP